MRKHLLTALLLACGITASALEGLTVTPATGDSVTFLFDHEPEVTFLAGKLQVKTTQTADPVLFDLDDIREISLGTVSGIDDAAEVSGIVCRSESGSVTFSGFAPGTPAAVFTADGRPVQPTLSADGAELTLSRNVQGTGVYIVKIGTFAAKVAL